MNSIGHHSLSIQWQKIRQRINSSLANVFNQSLSKDFYYSCVVDATPLFYWQSWGLVNSLIQCAKVLPQQIYVHCTPEVDRAFLEQLKTLGINLKAIERFGDGKYCNKIAQLKTEELTRAKCVFLLDTDTIVLGQLTEVYTDNVIKGKIVDLANPQLSVLQEIFTQAGFSDHPAICSADYEADLTFANNFNGGFYAVPGNLIKHLGERWHYWALWLIENCSILKRINKQDHVDQISFAMASHELSLSVEQINRQFNYPLHLEEEKTGYPRVIHYHRNISPTGMLEVTGEQDSEFSLAVEDANRLLGRCFNNQIFWSFRYQMYAELGSGVGSRGENLNYKRELLRKLGIETSQSILDVGCGDLEVIKAFKLSNYTGVDISSQAIELARQKRPDLNFILLENNLSIPAADLVICLEVLIHQHNYDDYQRLIKFLIDKTINKLIVSGYTEEKSHHHDNHMVNFQESLIDSLSNTGAFSHLEIVGRHTDVDIILAIK